MSDTPGQPAGGEGTFTPAPAREMTEQQVMDGIEGLLDERPRRRQPAPQQTPPPETVATDTGSQDPVAGPADPITGDTEEEQPESGDGEEAVEDHQIEPPTHWSEDDKAVFQQLTPQAQAIIARREREQNAAFTRKTQEIAEHRQALEATFGEIQTERQSYATNLQQLLFVAAPEAQKFAQVDWQRLASENPADYVRLSAERDALRGRIGAIQGELQRVQQQQQQGQAQQFAQLRQVEKQRLVEAIPDFGDAERGPKLAGDMRQWLQKQGFNDGEIGQVVDHRILIVVNAAMKADQAQQNRRQAETKRTTTAPATVQPPGAGRQRSDTQAGQRRAQRMEALKKSGSEKDAISYLLEIL